MSELTREYLLDELPRAVGTLLVLLPKTSTEHLKMLFASLVVVNGESMKKEKK